jgi:hypothetical protein
MGHILFKAAKTLLALWRLRLWVTGEIGENKLRLPEQ